MGEPLIPRHGGYKNTKTWQLADLIYDVTVRFCAKYIDRRSRTHDQMVQAARSGCQNLQEGSVDSATSKKIEIKLTGIAKGSLKELQRDFEKFLQHRDLPEWPARSPGAGALQEAALRDARAISDMGRRGDATLRKGTAKRWKGAHGRTRTNTDRHRGAVFRYPCPSVQVRVA